MSETITKQKAVEVLKATPAGEIAELDFVREKFIENYNQTHAEKQGELQYARQLVHFKQTIAGSQKLKECTPFSLYACFLTAAVNGYSLDPADSEVYLIPMGGKAVIWRQAGAHVRRLIRTGQIVSCDPAVLVYEGDEFEVSGGQVITHDEKFKTEEIKFGYVRVVTSVAHDGAEKVKYFIYRKSDWEVWRGKSKQKFSENWVGGVQIGEVKQPVAAFLRTKMIKHACQDKSWSVGSMPPTVETLATEVDDVNVISDAQMVDQEPEYTVDQEPNPTNQADEAEAVEAEVVAQENTTNDDDSTDW